jgi:hypothetical protein
MSEPSGGQCESENPWDQDGSDDNPWDIEEETNESEDHAFEAEPLAKRQKQSTPSTSSVPTPATFLDAPALQGNILSIAMPLDRNTFTGNNRFRLHCIMD